MKGLYLVMMDTDYADRAIDAGIDTFLIPVYNFPNTPYGMADTWEQNLATFERYKNRVRVIAVPVTYPAWYSIPSERQFTSNGIKYPGHFCPTNEEHIEFHKAPFRDLINRGLIHEVVWDYEHYTGPPKYFSEKIKCECPRCITWSQETQWNHRAVIMKKDTFSTGQLAIDSWWSVNCLNQKRVFVEGTYPQTGLMMRLQLWSVRFLAKFHGCNMTMVPGAFIEVFKNTDDFIKYLGYLKKHYGRTGYWIYSQRMLTKNTNTSQEEIDSLTKAFGYYHTGRMDAVDPEFFTKLKTLNG